MPKYFFIEGSLNVTMALSHCFYHNYNLFEWKAVFFVLLCMVAHEFISFDFSKISNSPVGLDIGWGTGSVIVLDSQFVDCDIAVRTAFVSPSGVNSILLDNVIYETSLSSGEIVMNGDVSAMSAPTGIY